MIAGREDARDEGAGVVGGVEKAADAWVHGKLGRVVRDANAVEGFVVSCVGFADGGVFHVGGGEEIAFVGGIDKYVSPKEVTVGGAECDDLVILFENGECFVERGCAENGEIIFGDNAFEEEFSDVGFSGPDGVCVWGTGIGMGGSVPEVVFGLPAPGGVGAVVVIDGLEEVAGESGDGFGHLAGVWDGEAVAHHASDGAVGTADECGGVHACGLLSGDQAGGSGAIDDEIVSGSECGEEAWYDEVVDALWAGTIAGGEESFEG